MHDNPNAIVEAIHGAWKVAMSHGQNLLVHEIYAETGGYCEDVFARSRRALKHWSMIGGGDPDFDDLLMVFVHADANWMSFLLQSLASAPTVIPPDSQTILATSNDLQMSAHELVGPRLSATSPMPHYQNLLGGLMRVCHSGDAATGENALKMLYNHLPEGRPVAFKQFGQILMNTHKDALDRGLPTVEHWADAANAFRGLGQTMAGVIQSGLGGRLH